MAFAYLEMTRRELSDQTTELGAPALPQGISKQERMSLRASSKNAMGDITLALNNLGQDGWQLVSVLEAKSYSSEIMYTFIKTI